MNKLALSVLAASAAAIPALAAAQTVNPPTPWEDVPIAPLTLPQGGAGVTWQAPAAAAAAPAVAGAAAAGARGSGPRMGGHRPGRMNMHRPRPGGHQFRGPKPGHNFNFNHHRPPVKFHHGRFNHHKNYRRIDRGHHVSRNWFGSRFHVQNWGLYGFTQPQPDWRWIRYYDDALLIDRDGRVLDGRWDMDWDRYGERWDYDESGLPVYYGDRNDDRYEDERDYAEEHDRGPDRFEYRDYKWDDRVSYHGAPYGYGYGPVVVTETTVTTTTHGGPTHKVVVETKPVEHHPVRVRLRDRDDHGSDCECPRHKKPKLYGERG